MLISKSVVYLWKKPISKKQKDVLRNSVDIPRVDLSSRRRLTKITDKVDDLLSIFSLGISSDLRQFPDPLSRCELIQPFQLSALWWCVDIISDLLIVSCLNISPCHCYWWVVNSSCAGLWFETPVRRFQKKSNYILE